ncbi:MAG TPA: IgGFc-binding protein, partial [Anseongella sp.]|nr:IgGFc-binding protein [Anseongella sp.]
RLFHSFPRSPLQQLSPVTSWGKEFVTVPFRGRNTGGDIYRVLASESNTNVEIEGINHVIGSAGEYIEFNRAAVCYISADKPVAIAQYQRGQDCDYGEGDPEMVLIAPLEQTFDNITFLSSPNFLIRKHYLNVVIKKEGVASFRLDGQAMDTAFRPVPGNPAYSWLQTNVSDGSHTLSAGTGFNAMAYGMGNYESYAYSAGGNTKNLDQELIKEPFNVKICQSDPRDFEIVIPFPAARITWIFEDAGSPVIDAEPANISSRPGEFMYAYPVNPIEFSRAGKSALTLAIQPEGSCDPPEQLTYEFEILPLPELAAPVIEPICAYNGSLDLSTYVSVPGGTFSGPGVVLDRFFYPDEAGTGTHEVTYTHTSEAGCTAAVSFLIEVRNLLT